MSTGTENLKIDILNKNHIPAVAEHYAELAIYIKENTNDDYFDFTSLSTDEIEEDLKSNLENNDFITYVALDGNKPVGFISGAITNCFLPVSKLKKVGYISGAYMEPEYRNMGIMKMLEDRIVEYFRNKNIKYIELNVITRNIVGKNCWNRLGYNTFREHLRKKI